MNISRRKFLGAAGLGLTGLLTGCGRTPPSETVQLESWDCLTGATLQTQTLRLPKAGWDPLPSSPQGFLFSTAHQVLAVGLTGAVGVVDGPSEALWPRPNLVVGAEKTNSDIYRVSGVELGSAKVLWKHDLGYGNLLAANEHSVFVGHPKGVSCFDLDSGKELWTNKELYDLKSWFLLPSSLVVGLGNQGKVCWVDVKTGKLIRSLTTTTTPNRVILVAGDDEYTLTFTRRIALATFRPQLPGPAWVQTISSDSHQSELCGYAERIALLELQDSTVAVDVVKGGILWTDALCPQISIGRSVALLRRGRLQPDGKMRLELEGRQLRSGKSLWKRTSDDLKTATAAAPDHFAVITRS